METNLPVTAKQTQLAVYTFAWRMGQRSVGWVGIVGSIAGVVLLLLSKGDGQNFPIATPARAVESIIPLLIGLQAALLLSPDDEPAFEVQLACPRPAWWLLTERLISLFGAHFMIALAGTAVSLSIAADTDVGVALARWVSPAVFFAGLAVFTTLHTRQAAFSVAMISVIWFIFAFLGLVMLPGTPTFWPFSLVQPHLWLFHIYLQPTDLSHSHFWVNRIAVALLGGALLGLAFHALRGEERLLTGSTPVHSVE
jgi:hypothetical protein